MLIKIKNSRLFNTSPSKRFANEYGVSEELWNELWKRHKVLEYTIADLSDFYFVKTGNRIRRRGIKRWLFLTEIYVMTKPARERGAEVINTDMFGNLEQRVVEEITRHMKSGDTQNSRIML